MRDLTKYETDQIHRIAGWKAEAPGLIPRLIQSVTHPLVKVAEKAIPTSLVANAIEAAYSEATVYVHKEQIARQAGVNDISALRRRDLRFCDSLADQVGFIASEHAMMVGAMSSGGGVLATTLYVKSLLTHCLKAIHTIGFCYGFGTDEPQERDYALGVLLISSASNTEEKQKALVSLGRIEDLILEEAFEELIEDAVLETIVKSTGAATIPALGMLVGAIQTAEITEHTSKVAKYCFQERWLRTNGLVTRVAPDATYARTRLGRLWSLVNETVYWTSFGLGFGLTYPVAFLAGAIPADNQAVRGLAAGKAAAKHDIERVRDWMGLGNPVAGESPGVEVAGLPRPFPATL